MIDLNSLVGSCDVLLLVFDCLRYDVAAECLAAGRTPNLAKLLPQDGWELRHAPGSFTLASHQAFFAGFLPTPAKPGKHPRPFAVRFQGSETTGPETCVFDAPDIVSGGVGFFNKMYPLGRPARLLRGEPLEPRAGRHRPALDRAPAGARARRPREPARRAARLPLRQPLSDPPAEPLLPARSDRGLARLARRGARVRRPQPPAALRRPAPPRPELLHPLLGPRRGR